MKQSGVGAHSERFDLELASSWTGLSIERNADFANLGFLSRPHPQMLTFVESRRFAHQLRDSEVACVITTAELLSEIPESIGIAVSSQPHRSFAEIHNHLATRTAFYWTDFDTEIDPLAQVHARAFVPARNVVIGAGSVVGPHVTIAERTVIGEGCVVHSGAVIGAEGFQTERSGDQVADMVHAGAVRVEAGVRIMANSVVARGLFREFTIIGTDARIGNLVFISHNVSVGRRASVGHGAVLNGGVRVGDGASIGPGSTIAKGVSIGAGARVSLGSTVVRDVAANESVMGMFAVESRRMLRKFKEIDGSD
jgi:UDP-3-O-[3-hydroxymyristoyl] glucosamine N-acyltransferase